MPRSVRGGLAEALSRRAIDPFVRLAGDPAAINKGRRDEQSGTTVAMSHGMHRLLSNGAETKTMTMTTTTTTSRWIHRTERADLSLDCIKAFPKWAIPKHETFSPSLPARFLFSFAVFILLSGWTVLRSITNDSQLWTTRNSDASLMVVSQATHEFGAKIVMLFLTNGISTKWCFYAKLKFFYCLLYRK